MMEQLWPTYNKEYGLKGESFREKLDISNPFGSDQISKQKTL